MSGIVRDGYALAASALLDDIICQALGCAAHHIDVHAVDTSTDNAAQACSTELQIHIKTLFDFILIMLDCLQFCLCILIEIWIGQPFPVNLHVIFHKNTSSCAPSIFKTDFITSARKKKEDEPVCGAYFILDRNRPLASFCDSSIFNFSTFFSGIQALLAL